MKSHCLSLLAVCVLVSGMVRPAHAHTAPTIDIQGTTAWRAPIDKEVIAKTGKVPTEVESSWNASLSDLRIDLAVLGAGFGVFLLFQLARLGQLNRSQSEV